MIGFVKNQTLGCEGKKQKLDPGKRMKIEYEAHFEFVGIRGLTVEDGPKNSMDALGPRKTAGFD